MTEEKTGPLYVKVSQIIKKEILGNNYRVGDLLPTEDKLQNQYNASRTTIRKAVDLLENEGFVKRHQGRGTHICSINPRQNLNYLSSINETLRERYGAVETTSISIMSIHAADIQHEFGLSEHEKLYLIQRTLTANNEVIAFIKNTISAKHLKDLENHKDAIAQNGLYKTIENEYHIKLDHAVENISVYMSGPLESELFLAQHPIPLFHSKRKTYIQDGTLIEIAISFIRAEHFEYTVYLKGRNKL